MNKNLFKKIATLGMLGLTLAGAGVIDASNQSGYQVVYGSELVLGNQLIFQNGDFSDGLNHWIVSSPGTENPTIVEENGNKYVLAKYGENIHQFLSLKPDTTYSFSYDVAGDENFPAKVEFGTLNHDEGFISLEEAEHNNVNWNRETFTFTTPNKENSYIIRFSSTGNGWSKFDNIQIDPEKTESNLLTIETESRKAFVCLNLDSDRFNSSERIMVYVDGSYHFETYEGVGYYSNVNRKDGNVQIRRNFNGKKGQVIEVYTAPRKPGQSSEGKQLLESYTLEADTEVNPPLMNDVVKSIDLNGRRLSIELDRETYDADNRLIIRSNGKYIAETYRGKLYYSQLRSKTESSITLSKDMDYEEGTIISVELSSGLPGNTSNVLQVLETFEVK